MCAGTDPADARQVPKKPDPDSSRPGEVTAAMAGCQACLRGGTTIEDSPGALARKSVNTRGNQPRTHPRPLDGPQQDPHDSPLDPRPSVLRAADRSLAALGSALTLPAANRGETTGQCERPAPRGTPVNYTIGPVRVFPIFRSQTGSTSMMSRKRNPAPSFTERTGSATGHSIARSGSFQMSVISSAGS
jgi:hypothetical protein